MNAHEEAVFRRNLQEIEKTKTFIVFCSVCGEYGHELPQESCDLSSPKYWKHKNCSGYICISQTTTHEMLDQLSIEDKLNLHKEISNKISDTKAWQLQSDQNTLKSVREEIERMNRGYVNPYLGLHYWKRSLLNNPTGVPYCPQCDSLLVQPIRVKKRLFSVGLFGMASDTVGKSMECLSCKYKW